MGKVKVYIAGPYTNGDVCENVANAMKMWHTLRDHGFSPYCPHLTHFLHLHKQRPYEEWLEYDNEWLEVCDVFLRMPGKSNGTEAEETIAYNLEIPVFNSLESLIKSYK